MRKIVSVRSNTICFFSYNVVGRERPREGIHQEAVHPSLGQEHQKGAKPQQVIEGPGV